jgi:hypothetical protein
LIGAALLLAIDLAAGARIYREVGPLPCASCHRRSGYGSTEGTVYVPPVTGEALFGNGPLPRSGIYERLFHDAQPPLAYAAVRVPHPRPPYTLATLAEVLREGRSPAGRTLDPIMPRYALTDDEVASLAGYLRSLSGVAVPGVDGHTIRFATVVTDGVAPERRRALLDVLSAYVRWKNAATAAIRPRAGSPLWYQQDFARDDRDWVLDVWELHGPAATWPAQLETFDRAQPVFAILGGVADDGWQPVHDFCERHQVPCVFPSTDRPAVAEGSYALYLSRGLAGEAQALARHLADSQITARSIVQCYRGDGRGRVPAAALRAALPQVQDRDIATRELRASFWDDVLRGHPSALVLWLEETDLATLPPIPPDVQAIYLSYGLLDRVPQLPADLRSRVRLTYPYALPADEAPHAYRVRAWLRARGITPSDERLQFNTWFTLAVADNALTRLAGRISRDAFIERVEEETESTLNPGVYPRLSLGPGQRFASTGSYIVALPAAGSEVRAMSDWIVP